jgi:hypothetical protein
LLAVTAASTGHADATPDREDLPRVDHPDAPPPAPGARRWHNTFVHYGHIFDDQSYLQTLTFVPRYHPMPELRLGLRLSLLFQIAELQPPDELDPHPPGPQVDHENLAVPVVLPSPKVWGTLSDLHVDSEYAPELLWFSLIRTRLIPSLRLVVPTSDTSRHETLILGLAPGLTLVHTIPVRDGAALRYIDLGYCFRAYKYFHDRSTAGCGGAPGCFSWPYTSWRLNHAGFLHVHIAYGLELGLGVQYIDDRQYETLEGVAGRSETLLWSISLRYTPMSWLFVTVGMTEWRPQPGRGGIDVDRYGHLSVAVAMDRLFTRRLW